MILLQIFHWKNTAFHPLLSSAAIWSRVEKKKHSESLCKQRQRSVPCDVLCQQHPDGVGRRREVLCGSSGVINARRSRVLQLLRAQEVSMHVKQRCRKGRWARAPLRDLIGCISGVRLRVLVLLALTATLVRAVTLSLARQGLLDIVPWRSIAPFSDLPLARALHERTRTRMCAERSKRAACIASDAVARARFHSRDHACHTPRCPCSRPLGWHASGQSARKPGRSPCDVPVRGIARSWVLSRPIPRGL